MEKRGNMVGDREQDRGQRAGQGHDVIQGQDREQGAGQGTKGRI